MPDPKNPRLRYVIGKAMSALFAPRPMPRVAPAGPEQRPVIAEVGSKEAVNPSQASHALPRSEFQRTKKKLAPISAFDKVKIRLVHPNERHAPSKRGLFNVVGEKVYILHADWPAVRAAIDKRRQAESKA